MHGSSSGLDHRLCQLEGVEVAAEARFRVGHNWRKPARSFEALSGVDLIGPLKSLINVAHDIGDAVRWIQTLIGIHLTGLIRICRYLPAAKVDGLEAGLDHLDRLIAS